MDIQELLSLTIQSGGSDLHLSSGMPPAIRVDGDLRMTRFPALNDREIVSCIQSLMTEEQKQAYLEAWEIDFAFSINALGRFRVNAFHQQRGASAAFRPIPSTVLSFEDIQAPAILKEIAQFRRGLVLVTGPTGSGKTTTLAAIIDYINSTRPHHIITIEDPIEFLHKSKKCLIDQREIFRDTKSFANALRSSLRQDPDVILVGELRDLETIRLALTAAETGHLVLATLHTSSAAKTIDRIIDVFPGEEKALARLMLSESLRAVISQTLIKKRGGGRIAAYAIMMCTPAIRHLMREGKVAQIFSLIQTGRAFGMQTLDQHLEELLKTNIISKEDAHMKAENKDIFMKVAEEIML